MNKVNSKHSESIERTLIEILSKQVAAVIKTSSDEVNNILSCFTHIDDKLLKLDDVDFAKRETIQDVRSEIDKITVHMQNFDIFHQRLEHIENVLNMMNAEIPASVHQVLVERLDDKVKKIYSSSQELNVHRGFDDNSSSPSELF